MVDRTVQAATAEGKWVGVCGGIAGDPLGAVGNLPMYLLAIVAGTLVTVGALFVAKRPVAEAAVEETTTGALTGLLYDLALAGKVIAHEMTHAGLVEILGQTGDTNV
jgi:hypothetical protein